MTFWHKYFNDFDTTYDLICHTIGSLGLIHPELSRLIDNSLRSTIFRWPDEPEMQEEFPDAVPTTVNGLTLDLPMKFLFVDRFRPFDKVWCQEWILWYYSVLDFYKDGVYDYEDIEPNEKELIGNIELTVNIPEGTGKPNKEDIYITWLTFQDGMHLNRRYKHPSVTRGKLRFGSLSPFLFSVVVTGENSTLVNAVKDRLNEINTDLLFENIDFDKRYLCRPEVLLDDQPPVLAEYTVSGGYMNIFNYRVKATQVYSWLYTSPQINPNDIILPNDNRLTFVAGFDNPTIKTPKPIQNNPPEFPPEITPFFNDRIYSESYFQNETMGLGGWYIAEIPINLEKAKLIIDTSTFNYFPDPDGDANPLLFKAKCNEVNNILFLIAATNNHWEIDNDITLENVGRIPNVFTNGIEFIFSYNENTTLTDVYGSWIIYEDIFNNVFFEEEKFVVAVVSEGTTPRLTNTNQQFNDIKLYSSTAILLGNALSTDGITGVAYLGAGRNIGEDNPGFVPGGIFGPRGSINPKTNAVILDSGPYFNHLFFTYEMPVGSTSGNYTAGYGYKPPDEDTPPEDIYYQVNPEDYIDQVTEFWENIEQDYFAMISNIDLKEIREIVEAVPYIDRAISAQTMGTEVEDPVTQELVPRPTNLAWHIMGLAKFFGMNYNEEGVNGMLTSSSTGVRERRPIQIVKGSSETAEAGIEERSGNYPFGAVGFSNENSETGVINFTDPVDSTNAYPQFVYKVKSNQFVTTDFGSTEIESGDYVICYTFQQFMQTVMQDLDKALGMANAGANAIPNADGSEKICTYEGLGTLVAENAYMLSAISRQSSQNLVSSLIAQAVGLELLKATGYPLQFKEIKSKVGGLSGVTIPYPALAENSPSINSQVLDILNNIGPLVANLLCPVEPSENSNL